MWLDLSVEPRITHDSLKLEEPACASACRSVVACVDPASAQPRRRSPAGTGARSAAGIWQFSRSSLKLRARWDWGQVKGLAERMVVAIAAQSYIVT